MNAGFVLFVRDVNTLNAFTNKDLKKVYERKNDELAEN
jgi:hypothetical protein